MKHVKKLLRHHVDDLSQDVLEDEEYPTIGPRLYHRVKDSVEGVIDRRQYMQ